jgi:hypothetical protein
LFWLKKTKSPDNKTSGMAEWGRLMALALFERSSNSTDLLIGRFSPNFWDENNSLGQGNSNVTMPSIQVPMVNITTRNPLGMFISVF